MLQRYVRGFVNNFSQIRICKSLSHAHALIKDISNFLSNETRPIRKFRFLMKKMVTASQLAILQLLLLLLFCFLPICVGVKLVDTSYLD